MIADPTVKEVALERAGVDPMLAMMERLASNKDVDVVKLQALIDMQKDIMAVNAKSAFDAAFARMQPLIPTIDEKKSTDKGTYAPREDIVEVIRPILSAHGFSLAFRTEWPESGKVLIVGILSHTDGHSRESQFLTAADQSGSKNAVQALGSAVEYGRRYTTTDLLNIVTRKSPDDDGKKSGQTTAPDGYQDWVDRVDEFVLAGCTKAQLTEKWNAAPEAFRKFMATTDLKHVEGWKKKATK